MARPKAKRGPKAKTAKKVTAAKKGRKSAGKPKAVKAVKKGAARKSTGSRRILSDAKIGQLQKFYRSGKQSAKALCKQFGISMATLFNYLKVKV
jgi:hypothetical protein